MEQKQMTGKRITGEDLLNLRGQPVEAFAHVDRL
jgi:hypothetical protein